MSSNSNVENLPPQVIRRISKELGEIMVEPMEGIKVYINDDDLSDIQAVIEGPAGTPYAGGQFKVKLVLSKDFPNTPPKGYFLTKIFHPNVANGGEICVNTLKKDWKAELGIQHILLTIKCLLIYPNPESALNEEAGKLLLEQYEDYSLRAKMMTEIHALPQGPQHQVNSQNIDHAAINYENSRANAPTRANCDNEPLAKKHAKVDKLKEKSLKDKKRTLKRL